MKRLVGNTELGAVMGKRNNYGRTPLVPILWQNIGLAVLAVAAIGAAIYLLVA